MRRVLLGSIAAVLALLGLAACAAVPAQQKVTLNIAATDNFRPILQQLAEAYHARQTWVDLELHTANTARLEQDFKDGAAYDLYITGSHASLAALASKDAINPRSLLLLAYNQLVIVAADDSALRLDYHVMATEDVRQIAVASPDLMLGHLTRQALTNLHYLPTHEAQPLVADAGPSAAPGSALNPSPVLAVTQATNLEPKLLVVNSEDDVIAAVKDGRAQVGITYSSYAFTDKKVRILQALQDDTGRVPYAPIEYDVGIPRNAPHNDEAWNFLNYLRRAEAHAIMQRGGLL